MIVAAVYTNWLVCVYFPSIIKWHAKDNDKNLINKYYQYKNIHQQILSVQRFQKNSCQLESSSNVIQIW